MDSNPCVAVLSCSSSRTPSSIIELLSEHTAINKTFKEGTNSTHIYSWTLNTKYYTAKVDLCPINIDETRCAGINDRIEACIIYFDSSNENGLEDIKVWDGFLKDCDPDVKLLITDVCTSETKISSSNAVKWCIQNGFELIEINPDNTKTEDADENIDDDIITEVHGVERIIEALQNHLWSNMVLKNKDESQSQNKENTESSSSIDNMISSMFNDDEADFTELFSQLHMMRESVQSLSVRERRQCAEQVVSAFWRAIGGDEEEIADI